MMIATAVIAVTLGVGFEAIRLKRHRDQCMIKANEHAQFELGYLDMEKRSRETAAESESYTIDARRILGGTRSRAQNAGLRKARDSIEGTLMESAESEEKTAGRAREEAARFAEFAAYHAALKQKYLRASDRPWRAVEPDPPPPEPFARGLYWSERGEYGRAVAAYEEAIKLRPDDDGSLNNLAWILSTCPQATIRDGKRAVELATRACELSLWENSAHIDTLAAAHAEAGDFKAAVELGSKAIELLKRGDPDEKGMRLRLKGYEANRAFREK